VLRAPHLLFHRLPLPFFQQRELLKAVAVQCMSVQYEYNVTV
jgi:hypothetical protein